MKTITFEQIRDGYSDWIKQDPRYIACYGCPPLKYEVEMAGWLYWLDMQVDVTMDDIVDFDGFLILDLFVDDRDNNKERVIITNHGHVYT